MPHPRRTLERPGPPVNFASGPLLQLGDHARPSRGANDFEYVLVRPAGTPESPGKTSPSGNTAFAAPCAEQSVLPNVPARGLLALSWHGYIVLACPGRNACMRLPA